MPKPKIFFSYRVADEKDFVFRICDRYVDHYGADNVFISPDRIPDGTCWKERILVELEKCDVIVAVIGPKWSELLAAKKDSTEEDFVLKEIAFGLENNKLVVPIRIKNSPRPVIHTLPEELQGISAIQFGEPVNDDATFRESVEKRIRYVDDEMTSRGFAWGNLQLESILSLPMQDLNRHIVNEIASGRSTSITLLIRDFVPYIQELSQGMREDFPELAAAAIDRLFVFGVAFVQDSQVELHKQFREVIRDIYGYIADSDFPSSVKDQMLLNLGINWYIQGATILRESSYSWLQSFLRHTMQREPYHWESSYWFYNLETRVAEANLLNDCGFIMRAHAQIKSSEFCLRLFANDETRALDLLCQLDFCRVLADCIDDNVFKANPSFLHYYHERTMPIVRRLLNEPGFRATLIGGTVDNEAFFNCVKHLLMYTCERPGYSGYWDGSLGSINRSSVDRILESYKSE